MAKLIELPNGEVAEFPDDMPDSDIEAALRGQPSSAAPSRSTGVLKADAAQPWQVPVAQQYPRRRSSVRGGSMPPAGSKTNPLPASQYSTARDGEYFKLPDGTTGQKKIGALEGLINTLGRTAVQAFEGVDNFIPSISVADASEKLRQIDTLGGYYVGDTFIPSTEAEADALRARQSAGLASQAQTKTRYDAARRTLPYSADRVAFNDEMAADQSLLGTIATMAKNPIDSAALVTESSGSSVPFLAASALTRNPYALTAIGGAAGFQQEIASGMANYLDSQGIPRDQWASLPQDVIDAAVDQATTRAGAVGLGNAVTGGLASRALVPRSIASTPAKSVVLNPLTQGAVGFTGDFTTESAAGVLSGQGFNPQESFIEGVAGFPQQTIESAQSTIEAAGLAGRSFVEVAPSADLAQMVSNPATPQEQRLEAALELMNRGESMPEAAPQAVAAQVDAGTVAPEQAAQLLGQQVERQAASEGALASTLAQAVQTPQEPVQADPLASDSPTAGDAFDTRLGEVARQIDERVANLERQATEIKQTQTPQAQPASDFGDLLNAPASSLLDILNRNPQSLGDIVGVPADDQTDILTAIARQVAAQTDQQPAPMADLSPAGGVPVVGQPIAQGRKSADTPLYGTGIDRGEQGEVTNESRFLEENMRSWAQSRADAGNPERDRSGQPIRVQDIRITELPRRSLFNSLAIALDVAEQTLVGPGRRIAVITDEGSAAPLWFDGVYQGNTLYLNATADKPLVTVAAHEFVHSLKQSDPDLYARLADYVRQHGDETGHSVAFGYNKEPGYTAEKGVEELTANLTGDALSDRAFLEGMAKREPSLFRDLAERFIDYLDELLAVFGRQKDSGVSKYVKDVQAFRELLADVLVEKAQRNQTKGDVLALADEIGWAQEGGKLIARNGMDEGVNGEGGGLQVTGRTTWEPKARADGGGMSNFWQMRPGDNPGEGAKISERAARLALKKYTNGEKLTTQERRFIEYAEKTAAEYRGERDGTAPQAEEQADPNNWIGADRVFTQSIEDEYGPAGVIREAVDFAKSAEAGTTTLEIKVRPSGKEWNVVYLSNGDGTIETIPIGAKREGNLSELVEAQRKKADFRNQMRESKRAEIEAEADRNLAIAKANGFVVGKRLGKVVLNSGKKGSAAVITEDNGDGKFTVEMTMGNQRGVVRDWDASAMVRAIKQANPEYVAPNNDNQGEIGFSRKPEQTTEVDGVQRSRVNSDGKPIAETDEALRNFWRWFGDSKVVDADGRPMVVYRSDISEFSKFDKRKASEGFFFGSNEAMAEAYGGEVRQFYLSVKNPLIVEDALPNEKNATDVKGTKFDGVINERADGMEFIATRPTQIKSATGNNGDFSPNDARISFSRRIEQLIPEATQQEQVKAAEADKDAKRNGNPQARSDMMAGDGELFAGERPVQAPLFSLRPEDVITEGRLLSLIDAAKKAGIDLSPLRKAHTDNDGEAVKGAIADILAKLNKPMRSTGTKNAVTDAEREAAGRSPILRDMVKTNEATVYEAIRTVKSDPFAGPEAISRLNRAGSEGISLEDEAVLLVYKTELMNKRDAAADKLADPKASEAVKDAARIAWEEAEAGIEAIDQASVNAGREWGRFGQFRQRMMKADFTLEAMERKERARLERPLTASEAVTIKAMADTIAELQKKVDILQERVANAASESAYDAMTRAMAKPMRQRKSLDYLRNAANDARARLNATKSVPSRRGQSGAIISPSVFYDYAVIGAYHIANGAAKFGDWVSAMRADLGQLFDEIKADHPNIFKASQKELERPLKADVTVEDVMAGVDFANIKAKDVRKLIEALVGEGLRGEPVVIGAASEKLGLSEDEVRALFVQTEPKGPQTLDEARQELSDLRKLVRLQNEIDRLEAGRPKPERNQQAADSPEVAERKQELADLRKRLRPVVDPEQRYQELRGKQIEKRIADLQARIERGDFTKKPRIPRPLNEANQRAMFELDKAKEDFLRYQYLESLKNRSKWGKAIGFVGDSFNLSRAVMTSIDLSGLLRQGGFITLGRPITGLRAFFGTLPTLFSDRAEHRVMNELKSRPNAPLYLKYKLALTNIGSGPLTRVEEAYAARWLDKVESVEGQPIRNAARKVKNVALAPVRGSGRAYAAFLSRLRADAFDAMAATMTKTGVPTEAEAKWIVDFVNTATGRAKIWGKSDNPGEIINTLAFAPRLVVSRLSLATATPVWTAPSGRAKKLAAMEYARFLTGVAVVSSLLAYSFDDEDDDQEYGDHFTFDPRSSDFMKLRFGNTRIDPFTGLSQVSVMLSRLATGETVNANGEVNPIRPKWTLTDLRRLLGEDIPAHEGITDEGKLAFGERNAVGVISSFLRSKLAPIPGAAVNLIAGSDFKGDPITIQEQAQALAMPMSFGDIADAMEENGVPRGTAMSMLALLGMSMQVQTPSNKQQFAEFRDNLKAVRTDVKERLSQRPVEEWPDAMEEMKREYGPVLEGIELDYYKSDGKYGNAGEPKRDKDGNPVLKSERLSEREKYDDGIDGTQVHHIIPDNLVRSHPLMAAARKAGYDLDNPQNLISMPDKQTDGEIAHKTDHPDYDAEVYGQLQDAVKRLKKEYGSLDEAPADALLDEVRKVEEAMRDRLKRKDVPTKDGRLAVNGRPMATGA